MSLINDALKRARRHSGGPPVHLPPVVPATHERDSARWLLPAVILVLVVAAGGLISLSIMHDTVTHVVAPLPPTRTPTTTPVTRSAAVPVVAPPATVPLPQAAAAPRQRTNPSPTRAVTIDTPNRLPRLQGVFYDPVHPAAIVSGKMLHVGDTIDDYRIQAISKSALTLVDSNGAETVIRLGH